MTVETARAEDIGALVELRLGYLREDLGALDDGVAAALPGYFEAHLNRDLVCFVARSEAGIAACAFLLVVEKPPSPAFPNGRTGTVLNVYTRPEYRRGGPARRVMRALVDYARETDVCVMNLKATDAGYPLYRTVGFEDDADRYHPMKWTR